MKLLVIEDDLKTANFLQRGLSEQQYSVDVCSNGETGLDGVMSWQHDLVILDVTLPIRDGWSVLAELRKQGCRVPVLMLTARDSVENRVRGLDLGADDYLTKPFAFSELLARVRSLLRRRSKSEIEELRFGDMTLNFQRHRVSRAGVAIDLTPKEFQLLALLLENQDQVLSQTFIAEQVCDMNFDTESNLVEVHIRRLRAKVDDPFERKLIQTVRGRGYVLR